MILDNLIPFNNGQSWGFCNNQKQIIIPCEFDNVKRFRNGIAAVQINYKWGFIDENGNSIVTCVYDEIKDYRFGFAIVKKNQSYNLIYKDNTKIVNHEFDKIEFRELDNNLLEAYYGEWSNAGNILLRQNDKNPLIEFDLGKKAFPFKSNSLFGYRDGYKFGIMNTEGKLIIPCKFDELKEIERLNSIEDGTILTIVNEDSKKKFGIINKEGKEIVPPIFDDLWAYKFITTHIGNLVGLYDYEGNKILPNIYYDQFYFIDEYIVVQKKTGDSVKRGVVDKRGKEVLPIIYDWIEQTEKANFIVVKKDELHGFYDKHMNEIIPLGVNKYSVNFYETHSDLIEIQLNDYNSNSFGYGLYNKVGDCIFPFDYEKTTLFQYWWWTYFSKKWFCIQKRSTHNETKKGNLVYRKYYDFNNNEITPLSDFQQVEFYFSGDCFWGLNENWRIISNEGNLFSELVFEKKQGSDLLSLENYPNISFSFEMFTIKHFIWIKGYVEDIGK